MSNNIVQPENIAKIANFISDVTFNTWTFFLPESIETTFVLCRDKNGSFNPEKICRYLAINNYLAVDGRYNKTTDPEEIESYYNECIAALKYTTTPAPSWEGRRIITKDQMQLYKTIQCYLYQIDSDFTYKNDIYNAIDDLVSAYSKWIVANSELYNDCDWK